MNDIFGLTCQELQAALQPFSLPKYRAKQIAEWMYQRGATSFGDMTNLSKKLREELSSSLAIGRPRLKDRLDSADGHTTKFLLEFADGTAVETVLMRQPYGNSICVSTQAGCNMGCAFCASTLHGMARNLTKGEILSQAKYERNEYLYSIGAISQDTLDSVKQEYLASKAAFDVLADQVEGGSAASVESKAYTAPDFSLCWCLQKIQAAQEG